jgi:hypothetical protein
MLVAISVLLIAFIAICIFHFKKERKVDYQLKLISALATNECDERFLKRLPSSQHAKLRLISDIRNNRQRSIVYKEPKKTVYKKIKILFRCIKQYFMRCLALINKAKYLLLSIHIEGGKGNDY